LPREGKGKPVTLSCGAQVNCKVRRVLVRQMQSLLVSGKRARVGSKGDVLHGLTKEQVLEIESKQSDPPEDEYRRGLAAPLLVIYLLNGREREDGKSKDSETPYANHLILPALSLHFPGEKDTPKSLTRDKRYVKYRLNRVAQAEVEEEGESGEYDADDD